MINVWLYSLLVNRRLAAAALIAAETTFPTAPRMSSHHLHTRGVRLVARVRFLPRAVPAESRTPDAAHARRVARAGARVAARVKHLARGLADRVDEAVENDKLELELDAVDARLERALEMKQVGALDAEKRNVERNDDRVGPDELPQDSALLVALADAGDTGRGGPGALAQRGAALEVLARLENVEYAEGRLLDEVDDELDAVPDEVKGGEGRVDGGGLLRGVSTACSVGAIEAWYLLPGFR